MPRLWSETIDAHRVAVRDAILDTAAALVAEHGLLSVTMSRIAEETGIGRATLYKYFPDAGAVITAWHDRQVAVHLRHLADVRERAGDAGGRLEAVLETYAFIIYARPHDTELAALAHQGEHFAHAQRQLTDFVEELVSEAAGDGRVRGDVPPEELARYCVNAIAAAGGLPSKAAVHRLVTVTLAGLEPNPPAARSR